MENILFICPICNSERKNLKSICKHISSKHKLKAKDVLFEKYPDIYRNCKNCGNKIKSFISDSQGIKTCSKECDTEYRRKPQSKETILKRVKNTNYKTAMENRANKTLEKYGVINTSCLNNVKIKMSDARKGKKNPRKNEEHQRKIIDSKIKNDTIKHSLETKIKMSEIQKKLHQNINDEKVPMTLAIKGKGGRNYKYGNCDNLWYRSSYEEMFINFCKEFNIKIESASNKQFRIRYQTLDNKYHFYYPDFYLPEYNLIVEIKPTSLLNYSLNKIKIETAFSILQNYLVVTEKELSNKTLLYENILSIGDR